MLSETTKTPQRSNSSKILETLRKSEELEIAGVQREKAAPWVGIDVVYVVDVIAAPKIEISAIEGALDFAVSIAKKIGVPVSKVVEPVLCKSMDMRPAALIYDEPVIELTTTGKMLVNDPEFGTVWNAKEGALPSHVHTNFLDTRVLLWPSPVLARAVAERKLAPLYVTSKEVQVTAPDFFKTLQNRHANMKNTMIDLLEKENLLKRTE